MKPVQTQNFLSVALLGFWVFVFSLPVHAQQISGYSDPVVDSFTRSVTLEEAILKNHSARLTETCNTSTFNLRLFAGTGEKAEIRELQTLPNGNFLLVGNITNSAGQSEGLVSILNNSGAVIVSKRITLNNSSTRVFNGRTKTDGSIYLCGSFNEGSGKMFLTRMNIGLITAWTTVFDTGNQPSSMFIDFTFDNRVTIAAQLSTDIFTVNLNLSGTVLWRYRCTVAGLDALAGIGHNFTNDLYVVTNCTRSGKKLVDIIAYFGGFGNVATSHTLGNSTEEFIAGRVSTFGNRYIITGVFKTAGGQFRIFRHMMFNSATTDLKTEYDPAIAADFTSTAAHDNSGDAMAFGYPAAGKMVFIKQFPEYQTTLEVSKSYDIPAGSKVISVTRSLEDGGYLFGLNNAGNDSIILIKTDSIGILAACGYTSLNCTETQTLNTPNTLSGAAGSFDGTSFSTGSFLATPSILGVSTLCNQPYCPPPPPDDTCLATYVKTFRNNSFSDAFSGYGLMRNNTHLFQTYRRDRVMNNEMQVTYGLKLFSERGDFIKGVNIFTGGVSSPVVGNKMDDQHMLLTHYSSGTTTPVYTFTMVNDSLNVIWSKSYQLFPGYNYSAGLIFGAVTRDNDGNIYYVNNAAGYFQNMEVLVHKMGPDGNVIWTKVYSFPANAFVNSSITVADDNLIIVAEGGIQGSISLRINKTTGQFLNAWLFNNLSAGSIYHRFLRYDNGHVFYAGSDATSNAVIGIFNSSGMPVRFRKFNVHCGTAAHDVKFGKFYFNASYYNGTSTRECLVRTDSTLTPDFINETNPVKGAIPFRMYVSDNGSIYHAGNFIYGGLYNGYYYDPYLKKTDTAGATGTCPQAPSSITLQDVSLNATPINATVSNVSFIPTNIPVVLLPDLAGHKVSELLCNSTINCTSISLSGPSAVCRLNVPFTYTAQSNNGCSLLPAWSYDPAFAALQSSGSGTAVFKFLQTGTTKIYSRINTGCTVYTDSIEVNIQDTPPAFSLGPDKVLCPGDSVRLHAAPGFSSYLWQDGSTDSVFIAHSPGIYFVEITNACGDRLSDTVTISGASVPPLNLGADRSVCRPDTLFLNAQPGFTGYQWFPASVIASGPQAYIIPTSDLQVSVRAITSDGCIATDTIQVTSIYAQPVFLGNDTSFCNKDTLVLSAGAVYDNYQWSTGASTTTISVTQPGTYWVNVTASNGCRAGDTLLVTAVFDLPQPGLGNDFSLCSGDTRQLNPGSFAAYLWQDGSTAGVYNSSSPGTYYVMVTDMNGCNAADTIKLISLLPKPSGFLKATDSLCQYSTVTIAALQSFTSYLWSNGSIQNTITVSTPGNYTLTVKNNAGCAGKDTIRIIEKFCTTGVFIPTAFTPNNDGLNDFFKPVVLGAFLNYSIEVYNRNGELVFTSSDPKRGWNGEFKGILQPGSVFVYVCRYQLAGESPVLKKGTVTLIR